MPAIAENVSEQVPYKIHSPLALSPADAENERNSLPAEPLIHNSRTMQKYILQIVRGLRKKFNQILLIVIPLQENVSLMANVQYGYVRNGAAMRRRMTNEQLCNRRYQLGR